MNRFRSYSAALTLAALLSVVARSGAELTMVRIEPNKSLGTWEAWGTSLCWWAKGLGARDDIADLLFTTNTVDFNGQKLPGLGLNFARYNVGACSWNEIDGRKMAVSRGILPFRQMEGFWLDGKSEDPQSASWKWTADANQRAMLLKSRARGAKYFELFSNSPMWWMCKNDNPSGAAKATDDNLAPANYRQFAVYLATVAKYARDHWGITFTSVEPFNEPTSSYWHANGKQEGCHFSHEAQAAMLPLLRAELDKRGLDNILIAASDESLYDQALATWNSFDAATKAIINQVNVHGYQRANGRRDLLFQAVAGKRLWNTEYGGNDPTGLGMAHDLHLDLRYLHPTAWTYWQPFDGGGWGLVDADMRSNALSEINPKYFVLAQYTRHIRPGMMILDTGETDTVAAFDAVAHKLVIVARNGDGAGTRTFDLSGFTVPDGPVARWITEPKGGTRYEIRTGIKLIGRRFDCALPANSIQTFEVLNVAKP